MSKSRRPDHLPFISFYFRFAKAETLSLAPENKKRYCQNGPFQEISSNDIGKDEHTLTPCWRFHYKLVQMNEVVMKFISVSKYATRNSQNNENLSLASIFRADSGNERD